MSRRSVEIFVFERLGKSMALEADRLARAIEATRFPPAADLIGQLGDPLCVRKANALYYEFDEKDMNRQLGYT
jgi:hypothetical protein